MSGSGYTREDFNDEMNDLELCLEHEQQCIAYYEESAAQVEDERVKAIYTWLVEAGKQRIAALQKVYAATTETLSWAPDVESQVRSVDASNDTAPQFDVAAGGKPGKPEIMTLRQGVELEKKTASIYHTAAQRSRDKGVRALWRYLAASEEAHVKILNSYFDGLMQLAMKKKK